jgi:hypothetical protein
MRHTITSAVLIPCSRKCLTKADMLANASTAKSISSRPIAGDLRNLAVVVLGSRVISGQGGTGMLAESAARVMRMAI